MSISGKALLLTPGVLLGGALGIFLITSEPAEPVSMPVTDISAQRESFTTSIQEDGGVAAYQGFVDVYGPLSFDKSHNAAHLFGEALYVVEGVSGITVCDTQFNFGCYHGFFTAAVKAEGLDVVATLDTACVSPESNTYSACQHGLGHGILEFVGHDNLLVALEACSKTNQPDPLAGCTGGVFMEYNVPLVASVDGSFSVAPRPLGADGNLFAPCDSLTSERFQLSCFQELPQWWKQVIGEDVTRMGALCTEAPSFKTSAVCFDGIAKIIPSSADYRVAASEHLCASLPGDWYDRCITQASWAFKSNVHMDTEAKALCSYAKEGASCPH